MGRATHRFSIIIETELDEDLLEKVLLEDRDYFEIRSKRIVVEGEKLDSVVRTAMEIVEQLEMLEGIRERCGRRDSNPGLGRGRAT